MWWHSSDSIVFGCLSWMQCLHQDKAGWKWPGGFRNFSSNCYLPLLTVVVRSGLLPPFVGRFPSPFRKASLPCEGGLPSQGGKPSYEGREGCASNDQLTSASLDCGVHDPHVEFTKLQTRCEKSKYDPKFAHIDVFN